ncbi:retrovirus-related Pol polyprotein from transposon TNT 1-94 [Nephila pilipes]|uniref:Retrovirus-related Pol polyprotein from transposon TNT 1-94 n=1 Tax=Nephila pilipes TaxID=299642 RepID=A0A8X6QW86_NEPPI|nr:retrovirus-related Pol polyprotein from transposon TNT 1-94 [Nephila pilipes]
MYLNKKEGNWTKKSVKRVFVGYSGEKMVIGSEKDYPESRYIDIVKKPFQTPDPDVEKEIEKISCSAEDTEETLAQKSSRNLRDRSILKMPVKFDNFILLADHIEPETYKEAMASVDSDKWLDAMKEELESLSNNNTWVLANLPSDRKSIGNRWVFKVKQNAEGTVQRFKARLVANGFSQKFGVDFSETFSAVVRWDTIRNVLSITAARKLKLGQFDVKTAFLNGDLSEDIYMTQP